MRDNDWLKDNVSNVDELIEAINSLGKTTKRTKDKLIEEIEINMDFARLKYDEGDDDHAERIEFADFYFEMSDILKELNIINEYEISKFVRLKLEKDRAWESLTGSVSI